MRRLQFILTASCLGFISTAPLSQPTITLDTVITGLTAPIQLVNAGDGSNRLFVAQQGGAIRVFDGSYNDLGTFLTVTGLATGGEQGLLSLVFHPDYENAASPFFGHFYVYYTNSAGNLQLARYQVSADPNVADPLTRDTILTISHPTNTNHNGGTLQFGNDGFLYLSIGDGGGANDVPNNAQNGLVMLGKLLRIDVNSSATAPFYSVPPSNPFVSAVDTLPEIYAFGLRNPFRWSFDRVTGDMWIGDVGQGNWEEITYLPAAQTSGVNFGWRCYEGNAPFNTSGCQPASAYTFPLHVYPNPVSGSSAVTGGTVYHGANTDLQGYYIASDFYSGDFFKIAPDGGGGFNITTQPGLLDGVANFGEAENGELYAVSLLDGAIIQLGTAAVLPVTLVSFTAEWVNGSVELHWVTSFEENLDRFEVQYSEDGITYSAAGSLAARNAPTGWEYQFQHSPLLPGRIYYRIAMVDQDGTIAYSNVLSLVNEVLSTQFIRPSVVTGQSISIYLPGPYSMVEVLDMEGRRIIHQSLNGISGRIEISLPPSLMQGLYIGRLVSKEQILSQRFMLLR